MTDKRYQLAEMGCNSNIAHNKGRLAAFSANIINNPFQAMLDSKDAYYDSAVIHVYEEVKNLFAAGFQANQDYRTTASYINNLAFVKIAQHTKHDQSEWNASIMNQAVASVWLDVYNWTKEL